MSSIRSLYETHGGYVSDKWSAYLGVYDELFQPFKERPITLLEIGVQNGGSLQILDRYFPNAVKLVGCDIDPRITKLEHGPKVNLIVGDVSQPITVAKIRHQSPTYDIIIDDGSHRSDHIISAFESLFPLLKPGGFFLAEDLHCSYSPSHRGRLFAPYSSIEYFKLLVDVVNADHWLNRWTDLLVARLKHPRRVAQLTTMVELKRQIRSIRFFDSICVIEKALVPTGLGTRVIAGREALVNPAPVKLRGEVTSDS
ncbi:MAG: class I SAM-dependent methyltransferase [Polyangiales bacterium]